VLKYRPDIDGLRALAVLPVVLFHAEVPGFSGGFVGMDIFFVISGYLITFLMLNGFADKKFSFLDFYMRRARRLFPALVVMVVVTLLAGFFLLLPDELAATGRVARRVAYFSSNHALLKMQGDYWQQNLLATQPLLHTWSLAVEEQFYLLPARAWELLLGALLVFAVKRQDNTRPHPLIIQVAGLFGLGLIGWSVFTYTNKTLFPGLAALAPCLGAALVIYAGSTPTGSWVSRLLSTRLLVFVGLISYSLYLWHWPILILSRSIILEVWHISVVPVWFALTIVGLVSCASWRWVEQPFRRKIASPPPQKRNAAWRGPAWACAALVLCWMTGTGARQVVRSGWPLAQPLPDIFVTDSMGPIGSGCVGTDIEIEGFTTLDAIKEGGGITCVFGGRDAALPRFALIGDSYAFMWAPALDSEAKTHQQPGIGLTWSGCAPLTDFDRSGTRQHCAAYIAAALDYVASSSIQHVILAGYWPAPDNSAHRLLGAVPEPGHSPLYTGLDRTLARLRTAGKQVYLLRGIPGQHSKQALQRKWLAGQQNPERPVYGSTLAEHRQRQKKYDADIDALQAKYHFTVLDPALQICPQGACLIMEQGQNLYFDPTHLNDAGAYRFREVFLPLFESLASSSGGRMVMSP